MACPVEVWCLNVAVTLNLGSSIFSKVPGLKIETANINCSSKSCQPPIYDQSRGLSNLKIAPVCSEKMSMKSSPTKVTKPIKEKHTNGYEILTRIGVRHSRNLWNIANASSGDEILFVNLVDHYGFEKAIQLASILNLRCLRSLQSLRSSQFLKCKNRCRNHVSQRINENV